MSFYTLFKFKLKFNLNPKYIYTHIIKESTAIYIYKRQTLSGTN